MQEDTNKPSLFSSGAKSLSLIARFHHKSLDVEDLIHEFDIPSQDSKLLEIQLIRASRSFGFKAKVMSCDVATLDNKVLPAMAKHKSGHYVILAKVAHGQILVHDIQSSSPQKSLSLDEFKLNYSDRILFLSPRQAVLSKSAKFGFGWFVPVMFKYRNIFSDVLLASFFIQLLALASPIFFQVAIDKVMVHKGMTTLDVLAVGFFFIITFEVILSGLRTYLFSHTTNRVDVELGSKLYQHMLHLPLSFFRAQRVGDTVARVKELDTVREFITGSALTIVLDMFFTLVFFAVMFYYAPFLTWIVVGSLPFYFIIAFTLGPRLRKVLEDKFQRSAENHAFLVESVNGVETIKSLAVEPKMRNKWDDKLASYVSSAFKSSQLNNIYGQCSSFVTKLTSLLILYFGAIAVTDGSLTIGQFIAFNLLAQRIAAPIMRFANVWQDFQQARISVERLGDILNTPLEAGERNKITLPKMKGHIEFEHINFRYNPSRSLVLSDINLKMEAGEVIGLVGRSGSGKSSLTKLIQRLYLPESGRVLVDGVDLALINPTWLRQQVGVVLQENFLFNASVRENISLSDPGASLERVISAAKLAGAHEFILELPHAYDSQVGEQGSALSGGQRQRLAIARALLTNPSVLIFDEATSALDYESELIIQKNMTNIAKGRTVLIIAHRLSAVRHADRIVVLDKGRIVESGTHTQLLNERGHYHYLQSIQLSNISPSQELVPDV
ncbi:type I secretion system permease/ATPase [Pseudoalteromonas ruthenica]|uniref:type I secretion system permease/ATPase n=1 Tax=Pseudoalteromonas ruthenica TaxID=151081 RepID=UPI00110A6666|nr:type I secretion system permease/ATPase [Pseudoalteromonas ruthenica]TMO46965.1 type I secretion system permease/ATPase [Pseudoalteromonas ruthenica]TMO52912.1 type I secretion system permease/ATPase [Pseudoalteromonas ruthenica]